MPLPFKFQTGSDAPAQPEARLTLRCAGLALAQVTGPREGQADDEVTATGLVEQMVRRSALSRNKTAMFRMRSLTHYTSPPPDRACHWRFPHPAAGKESGHRSAFYR